MSEDTEIKVGQLVTFTGFTDADEDMPDNGDLLVEGEDYEVSAVNDHGKDEEESYHILADNPDYDSKKRKSKNNTPTIPVDVFANEIAALEDEDEEEAEEEVEEEAPVTKKAPAKKKTTAKKPAAKKPAAKKKTPAKKPAAKKKTKLKETEEDAPKVEAEKGMIILQEHEEDETVLAMIEESEDICELAKEQCEENAHADYTLGGILYHVRTSGEYKELEEEYAANKGFALYCEEELGLKYRKAMYLIDIYTKFNRFNISGEKVGELGWTKSSVIAGAMNDDNAEELIELAEESTVTQLKDSISESYSTKGASAGEKVKRVGFRFSLVEDAGAAIAETFQAAKEMLNVDNDNDVFEHIVNEWALEHLNVKKARGKKKAA